LPFFEGIRIYDSVYVIYSVLFNDAANITNMNDYGALVEWYWQEEPQGIKNCPSDTSSTTKLTDLRGDRPATDLLRPLLYRHDLTNAYIGSYNSACYFWFLTKFGMCCRNSVRPFDVGFPGPKWRGCKIVNLTDAMW